MLELHVVRSEDIPPARLAEVRTLLLEAFGGDFTADDWDHTVGGWHVIALDEGPVAHACAVERAIEVGGRVLRTGYVEGVATAPRRQRTGLGTAVMRRLDQLIDASFDLGALSTGSHPFYERLGWERWQGPSYVRHGHEVVRTLGEDDGIMVRRGRTTADLDPTLPIVCPTRPGDDW
ncbi:MAG: GNAT family N-acetyltransferase [Acidimicrobiales bacterium]